MMIYSIKCEVLIVSRQHDLKVKCGVEVNDYAFLTWHIEVSIKFQIPSAFSL
jgi:hypothetical protein